MESYGEIGQVPVNLYRLTFQPSETMKTFHGLFLGNHNTPITFDIYFYNCLFIDPYNGITE